MKLFAHAVALNPRRVIIYLHEKGLSIPREDVDILAGHARTPDFLAKNPAGKVPVLELDDGSHLTESAAIIEYIEELHPDRPMIGTTPETRAKTRALERIAGLLIDQTGLYLRHSHPLFADRIEQKADIATFMTQVVEQQLGLLEQFIGDRRFLAGDSVSIADCTLFALVQTCRVRMELPFASAHQHLDAWYRRFAQRPSAQFG